MIRSIKQVTDVFRANEWGFNYDEDGNLLHTGVEGRNLDCPLTTIENPRAASNLCLTGVPARSDESSPATFICAAQPNSCRCDRC
jgi:hypothetical protein